MRTLILIFCCLSLPLTVSAHKKKHDHGHDHHHEHKHQHGDGQGLGSHVHGEVEISLVSSEKQLAVQLSGPAESFIGFEHEAKTDEEKKKIADLKERWTKNLFEMFTFKSGVCKPVAPSIKISALQDKNGKTIGHSTVNAEAVLECPFDLKGQSLTVKLRELFPRIEVLKIEALPENKNPIVRELKGETKVVGIEF